jgi:hypothetical protein
MLLKSILNRVQLHHGFVYGSIRLLEQKKRPALEVEIRPRKSSHPRSIRDASHIFTSGRVLETPFNSSELLQCRLPPGRAAGSGFQDAKLK